MGGLVSENVRWAEAVEDFKKQEETLCGDVLIITAFISYLGYFTKHYRLHLMDDMWKSYFSQLKVRGLVFYALSTLIRIFCQTFEPLVHTHMALSH